MLEINITTLSNITQILLHEVKTRTSVAFQNLQIDEQYVIYTLPDDQTTLDAEHQAELLAGDDNTYADGAVIFAPTIGEESNATDIKEDIIRAMMEFINNPEMVDHRPDSLTYVAFRTTKSGLWIFISDASPESDEFINFLIDDLDTINPTDTWTFYGDEPITVDNQTLYTTGTPEESSGPDFCNALGREHNAIVALMESEGLFTKDVNFEVEED